MSGNKQPVSIVICALNEEHRIEDAIHSAIINNPSEIFVVEGGSVDRTVEVAKKLINNVVSVERINIGFKRAFGVEISTEKYILFLDSDNVLSEEGLSTMIKELDDRGLTGIQANVKSIVNNTYWEKGMEYSIELDNIGYIRDSSEMVIGMPCLYKLDVLKEINFDKNIGAADDTDLCYRLGKAGHKLGISTAICYQKHRANFKSTVKKFLWYGEGDCEFSLKHKDRFWSIYSHPIRNYFFKKSFLSIWNGRPYYVPYFMLVGIIRHVGFYKFLFKNKFGSGVDSRTLNKHDKDY